MQLLFHYRSLFFNKLTYLDQNRISLEKMDNPAVADHPNIIMRFCYFDLLVLLAGWPRGELNKNVKLELPTRLLTLAVSTTSFR